VIRSRKIYSILIIAAIIALIPSLSFPDKLYAPDYLWKRGVAEKTDPIAIADTHLGIPYRDDGALDDQGRFTTFGRPDHFFDIPGLNCSGLVLSVCRFIFDKNWTLTEATRDRQGNSGQGAALGKDWDFGFDLILNLSDGVKRRVIMPDGREVNLDTADGMNLRGFRLDDRNSWTQVINQMMPGYAYFGDISKPAHQPGYKVIHYHVVIAIPDGKGAIWLYHATQRSNVHKIDINSPQGLAKFMGQFRGTRGDYKDILFVEAKLPDLNVASEDSSNRQDGAPRSPESIKSSPVVALPGLPPGASQEKSHPSDLQNETQPQITVPVNSSQNQSVNTSNNGKEDQKQVVGPQLELTHLAGKVFNKIPDIVTHIPKFSDDTKSSVTFIFQNRTDNPRSVKILLKTPSGERDFQGSIPSSSTDFEVVFPRDFAKSGPIETTQGEYVEEVTVDGKPWLANVFQIDKPREAEPKILNVKVPKEVQPGKTFALSVTVQNKGAESDYGGITVSSPDPQGLRIVSCKPGRVFPAGSTVLSITSDKIRTKVPMAEQWIELWGENKTYEMQVGIQAGRPGTYPLYVRCALRGVNVKSSVILMDPPSGQTVDQQGFPVQVYNINVR
jgi:hypothetical protein